MTTTEIMLDESATVVKVHVASGTTVQPETLLFEIQNSKAVQRVLSPAPGILTHALMPGQSLQCGVAVAHIVPVGEWLADPASEKLGPQIARDQGPLTTPRMSRAAAVLIEAHGLEPAKFKTDFVTTRIVHEFLSQRRVQPTPKPALAPEADILPVAAPPTPSTTNAPRPVEARKRAEISALGNGPGSTFLSVLGVTLGPIHVERSAGDLLEERITDLVIYEASRLMKRFPNLNAAYAEGQIVTHRMINGGLAIDAGGRLVVYGIEHSDQRTLHHIAGEMTDAVERYLARTLTFAEMTRATFTVTDLSGDELDFIFPLLPKGQTCILGVTQSNATGFRIFAGFDHRVTEGREVASFLGELRNRLLSFHAPPATVPKPDLCAFCGRSAEETFHKGRELGLLKLKNRDGNESLCCASCWNGW